MEEGLEQECDGIKGHEEEHEPSILEYARFYDLARDHTTTPLLQVDCLQWEPEDVSAALVDSEDLLSAFGSLSSSTHERLSGGREAAGLLSWARQLSVDKDVDLAFLPRHRRSKFLKLELPVLKTDNALDMEHYAAPFVPCLEGHGLSVMMVDEEADQGLAWPSAAYQFAKQLDIHSRGEKIGVAKEVLLYLQEVLRSWSETDGMPFDWDSGAYKKVS